MTGFDKQTQDFSYDSASDASGLPARVAIFSDRSDIRAEVEGDLAGAGFRTIDGGPIARLFDGPVTLLGDVVMVDCPVVQGETLAALLRLDMRVAQAGAKLIVATSMDALETVFAALEQSDSQILVQPSRAERIIAVGRVLADIGNARVREMSEEDRLTLLRLSRQVEEIAQRLDQLSYRLEMQDNQRSDRLGDTVKGYEGAKDNPLLSYKGTSNSSASPAPDPGLVRKVIAARRARAKFFDAELFADPAWDMLLDLTAAEGERSRVSVTSLCIAAAVPATTGLRWIKQLVDSGVFVRVSDPNDKRRAFIELSEKSSKAMAGYFAQVEVPIARAA